MKEWGDSITVVSKNNAHQEYNTASKGHDPHASLFTTVNYSLKWLGHTNDNQYL